MSRREELIKKIKFRIRNMGMKEVYHLLEERLLKNLDEMSEEELDRVLGFLEKDEITIRHQLLKGH